jgi:hypothetical protein
MLKTRKTLTLKRQSIRSLGVGDLIPVYGGAPPVCTQGCGYTLDISICECVSFRLSCR